MRHDVMKARATVSKLEHNVTSTRNIVSNIHGTMVKGQEGIDGKNLLVSDTRTVPTTECMLIVVQTSQVSIPGYRGSNILHLYLAHLVNYLPRRQEHVSVVTS